jgi:hypothetical protein
LSQNEDPMGSAYWARFEDEVKRTEVDRNRRADLYGGIDPHTEEWRDRPRPVPPAPVDGSRG